MNQEITMTEWKALSIAAGCGSVGGLTRLVLAGEALRPAAVARVLFLGLMASVVVLPLTRHLADQAIWSFVSIQALAGLGAMEVLNLGRVVVLKRLGRLSRDTDDPGLSDKE